VLDKGVIRAVIKVPAIAGIVSAWIGIGVVIILVDLDIPTRVGIRIDEANFCGIDAEGFRVA
jgi:hypothetical protein